MRETISGPEPVSVRKLGSVVRSLTFADATPAPQPKLEPIEQNPITDQHVSASQEVQPSQPVSAPIRVVLRVRPLNEREKTDGVSSCVSRTKDDDVVRIRPFNPMRHPVAVRNANSASFRFDRVFDEHSTQSDVFDDTALPMVGALFRGVSSVIFAYGVTCSGKTWTIQGTDMEPGVLPRSLDVIVNSIAVAKGDGLLQDSAVTDCVAELTEGKLDTGLRRTRRGGRAATKKVHDSNYIEISGDIEYKIFASYLEIYNEECYDLFERSNNNIVGRERADGVHEAESVVKSEPTVERHRNVRAKRILKLKDYGHGEVFAEGITEIEIRSGADIDRLLEFGRQNRFVASTSANETSSRSHAVFFITLKQTKVTKQENGPPKTITTTSRLSIVDLAGSERTSRIENAGARLIEANKINTSLMNLGRCLEEMRHNQKVQAKNLPKRLLRQVPFRNSRLTRLLQRNFESGSAVMIANVSPAMFDADETIFALRCSAVAREVRVCVKKNRGVLKDRSNVLQNVNMSSNKKAKPPVQRTIRTRGIADRENRNVTGITKPRTDSYTDKTIANLKKEVNLLRMELEEERCARLEVERALRESDQAKEEMYKENDELFRLKEKLIDKLAESEARIKIVEQEVREEVVDEAEKIISHLQETYQQQINESLAAQSRSRDSPRPRPSIVCDSDRKERAEYLANRVAMRASRAAFDGIRVSLANNNGILGHDAPSPSDSEVEDIEYIEED